MVHIHAPSPCCDHLPEQQRLPLAARLVGWVGADRAKLQDTILKLAAEVRQQLGLQLNISRTLIDLKVVT